MNGIFCLSIDTEICDPENTIAPSRINVLNNTIRLNQMLKKYKIHTTWAIVADLLCKNKVLYEELPLSLKLRYAQLKKDNYLPELVEILKNDLELYEIASHSLSHHSIDKLSKEEAYIEFKLSKDILELYFETEVKTIVFPRNRIAHLPELVKAGYCVFRDVERPAKYIKKNRNTTINMFITQLLITINNYKSSLSSIFNNNRLVSMSSSTFYFTRSKLGRKLDKLIRKNDSLYQISKNGIDDAIKNNGVFHLYFHPGNFKTETDFTEFKRVLSYVHEKCNNLQLESLNMFEIAKKYDRNI
jgi:peptidoglycan/xylan/chitin deacetylase (PgdA/CDA1 family)